MTDNQTIELLCKLLEERGIKWSHGDAAYEIEWSTPDGQHCSAMYWKPTFTVLISGCTPEQAIFATLGIGRESAIDRVERFCSEYADLLKKAEGLDPMSAEFGRLDQEEARMIVELVDALAELRSGTCENIAEEWNKTAPAGAVTSFCCSVCGAHYIDAESYYAGLSIGYGEIRTNFCPNCGRKVVDK